MLDDLFVLRERARHALANGDLDAAAIALTAAAAQTEVAEHEYESVLRALEEVLARRGEAREALSVCWYLARNDAGTWQRAQSLLPRVPAVDRARSLSAQGRMDEAAREMESAKLLAAAAIYREKASDWAGALALWSRLLAAMGGGAHAYNLALVEFNLARCAKQCGDLRNAREAIVAAVRLLEEAADHFESIGLRERAFDCFQVLVQIGKEGGTFEDVLEGFVNCIRILREDNFKYFALQYFDDALTSAKSAGEFSAAATLAREAAAYARALGLGSTSAYYTLAQADLWANVAEQHLARGAPPDIAENALLEAVLAFGEVGRFTQVEAIYSKLSRMPLEPTRQGHYARAAKRYDGVRDDAVSALPLPQHLRQTSHFPDVWHVDTLEWEQQGGALEACADVLLDTRWPDLIRRKALLARLTAFQVEGELPTRGAPPAHLRARLAAQLAELQLYAVLSPLEKLFESPEREVRIAVLDALRTLFFKRSFITIRTALRDPDPAVIDHAAHAVSALCFQHAFEPLARIVRESPLAHVRASALSALAKIDTVEAAEFLLGVLEHGAPIDHGAAIEALKRAKGGRFVEVARTALGRTAPGPSAALESALNDLLRARGGASRR